MTRIANISRKYKTHICFWRYKIHIAGNIRLTLAICTPENSYFLEIWRRFPIYHGNIRLIFVFEKYQLYIAGNIKLILAICNTGNPYFLEIWLMLRIYPGNTVFHFFWEIWVFRMAGYKEGSMISGNSQMLIWGGYD